MPTAYGTHNRTRSDLGSWDGPLRSSMRAIRLMVWFLDPPGRCSDPNGRPGIRTVCLVCWCVGVLVSRFGPPVCPVSTSPTGYCWPGCGDAVCSLAITSLLQQSTVDHRFIIVHPSISASRTPYRVRGVSSIVLCAAPLHDLSPPSQAPHHRSGSWQLAASSGMSGQAGQNRLGAAFRTASRGRSPE